MNERDSKDIQDQDYQAKDQDYQAKDQGKKQSEWDKDLAGPRGSTAAAYETAHKAQAESEGLTPKTAVTPPMGSRPISAAPGPVMGAPARGHADGGYSAIPEGADDERHNPVAENERTVQEGDATPDGRRTAMSDQRDPEDIQNVRRADPEGKRFAR